MAETKIMSFKLGDKPPAKFAAFVGLQHLLAIFGGIVTAPLLVSLGMNLSAADTTYLISAALVISGFATLLQISRVGPIGSGLLSIQGTSFTFIGPLVYAYSLQVDTLGSSAALGMVFTACLICSLAMACLAPFIKRLGGILTANVAAATVILLGITLVWSTITTIRFDYQNAVAAGRSGWVPVALATVVFLVITVVAISRKPLLRMSSIVIGLLTGLALAVVLGVVDWSQLQGQPAFFVPTPLRYPPAIDWSMVLILLPVFIVSATESIGDLTATASLSGLPTNDASFWRRLRGGILADSINSAIAAIFSTFPNTTFSQNNGVIRLTGVSSRRVGRYVALFLILLGLLPVVAAVVQVIPGAVVAGATLLMFFMVGVSGYHIALSAGPEQRDWTIIGLAIVVGLSLPLAEPWLTKLPTAMRNFLGFPVSSGAFVAIVLELLIPRSANKDSVHA